ncbi:MAG: SDR family oxidoreductase [Holosporaceae bacterium]|jgi:nucleoside-diphosphate-sugar epimerase|nr:SDR family oxidoreductase [Holosporaceae bacterium]
MESNNILITGINGYLGRNFLQETVNNNYLTNYNVCFLTSKKINGYCNIIHDNYSFKKEDFFKQGISEIKILIILGAFCPKNKNQMNEVSLNISSIISLNYLLANLPNFPEKIIYISSISVYGKKLIDKSIISENTVCSPDSLYGDTKLYSEKIIKTFCESNNIEYQILRMGVIYGGIGELKRQGTIPTIVRAILKEEILLLFNEGKEVKYFIHIKDCINIIIKSILFNTEDRIINIVSNEKICLAKLAEIVAQKYGKKLRLEFEKRLPFISDAAFDNTIFNRNFGNLNIPIEIGILDIGVQ